MAFYSRIGELPLGTKAFEFGPKGRWAWLQSLCWNFLRRQKCLHPHFDSKDLVQEVLIDQEKITEAIMQAMVECARAYYLPTKVYLGWDEFTKLCADVDFCRRHPFTLPSEKFQSGHRIFDLPIYVIPHMQGILVV